MGQLHNLPNMSELAPIILKCQGHEEKERFARALKHAQRCKGPCTEVFCPGARRLLKHRVTCRGCLKIPYCMDAQALTDDEAAAALVALRG